MDLQKKRGAIGTHNRMVYKMYLGTVAYSYDDDAWYGNIENIADNITYSAKSLNSLYEAFCEKVDEYERNNNEETISKRRWK